MKKTAKELAGLLGDNKQTVEAIDIIKQKADELVMIALDLEATADICIRRLTFQGSGDDPYPEEAFKEFFMKNGNVKQ